LSVFRQKDKANGIVYLFCFTKKKAAIGVIPSGAFFNLLSIF